MEGGGERGEETEHKKEEAQGRGEQRCFMLLLYADLSTESTFR